MIWGTTPLCVSFALVVPVVRICGGASAFCITGSSGETNTVDGSSSAQPAIGAKLVIRWRPWPDGIPPSAVVLRRKLTALGARNTPWPKRNSPLAATVDGVIPGVSKRQSGS